MYVICVTNNNLFEYYNGIFFVIITVKKSQNKLHVSLPSSKKIT